MENPENIEKRDGSGVAFKTIVGVAVGAIIGYGITKVFPKTTSAAADVLRVWQTDGLIEETPKQFAPLLFSAIGGVGGGIGALITGSHSSKSR